VVIYDARLARSINHTSLGKIPQEGKALSTQSHGKLVNNGKIAKAKGRSHGPKPTIYIGGTLRW